MNMVVRLVLELVVAIFFVGGTYYSIKSNLSDSLAHISNMEIHITKELKAELSEHIKNDRIHLSMETKDEEYVSKKTFDTYCRTMTEKFADLQVAINKVKK
ncbi:MAG: hypothetical protein WCY30_00500 [Candidatus Neomarinimicrobiota bacterium]|jgi:hypothetical protein